jgi:CRISPR-associated protein Cas2
VVLELTAMMVLVTYDVETQSPGGARRLRRVAKTCEGRGQRVQLSVFEMDVTPAEWIEVRARLEREIDPARDSLRFYFLGSHWKRRVEHIGAKQNLDLAGPLFL